MQKINKHQKEYKEQIEKQKWFFQKTFVWKSRHQF